MIQFDFKYYRPETIEEALKLMSDYQKMGKKAVYYGGGTELITHFRNNKIIVDAVIDLKSIKELTVLSNEEQRYTLGAALSLNQIIEETTIEPLAKVLRCIADHTTRNALTLGGNICGRLPYREAVLPLLALDATAVIASIDGLIEKPLRQVFNKHMQLKPLEFLAQIKVNYNNQSCFNRRVTEGTKVDYPILHLVSMKTNNQLMVALSGYGSFPLFEVFQGDDIGNIEKIADKFINNARKCQRASVNYRKHLLLCAIEEMTKGGEIIET